MYNARDGRLLPAPQPLDPLLAECRHVNERPFVFDQSEQLKSLYIDWVMAARPVVPIGDTKQGASFVGAKFNKWVG
jgi:hypothetical protein